MHSTIFQVTDHPLCEVLHISEDTEFNNEWIDYTYNLEYDNQVEMFDELCEALPEALFERADEFIIRYKGGIEDYVYDQMKQIMNSPNNPTVKADLMGGFTRNPLNVASMFYLGEDGEDCATHSNELVRMVRYLKPGALLYVGGVVGYHY